MVQQIQLQDPPQHEYVLQATFPSRSAGPWSVEGFPTDWRLVVPPTRAGGPSVFEVNALVPGGRGDFSLGHAVVPGPGVELARLAFDPATLKLAVDGSTFTLTSRAWLKRLHRRGRVEVTAAFHRDLGVYGDAEYWIDARAGSRELDVTLLWHRAMPGPDFRVSSARLVVPDGASCVELIPDPGQDGPILAPGLFPQQFARVFRFAIVAAGATPERAHVGTGDWTAEGFLPAGLPIPKVDAVDYAPALAEARWRLANLLPSPEWGATPVSPLWPAKGVRSGSEAGGEDRYPLDGSRWAASRGDPDAHEWYLIEQLRNLSRARIRLGPNGDPLQLPASGGEWDFWDGFLAGHDAPWNWSSFATLSGPDDPRAFADYEVGGMMRRLNENWALVWLANDPLARLLTLEGATRARLTFYEGSGRAHRLDVPAVSGLGSDYGIWQASAALAIAPARALGDRQYETWAATYLAHLRAAQMPSGCFYAHEGGYPADRDPFFNRYLLQGGAEFAYSILAAYELGDEALARSAMRGVEALASDDDDPGFYYFTATGLAGSSTRYLRQHPAGASDAQAWPAALYSGMGVPGGGGYYTAWDMGYVVALALATGAPEGVELSRRFAPGGLPEVQGWGLEAPSAQTGAPFEQWGVMRGILQR